MAGARVGVVYVVLSGIWIVVSDRALASMVDDPTRLTLLQTWKGWGFVVLSGLLLVALVRRELRETHRSEDRFRSLVEQTLVGVYVIRGGRFLYANPRCAAIFGFSQDEMSDGVELAAVVAPDDRDRVADSLRSSEARPGQGVHHEFRGLRRDGSEVPVTVFGRRVELDDGPAVIGVLLDRTEETRLEGQLLRARRMEAIGQLTGAVAHDFNNLLTAIIAPLDLCIRDTAEEAPIRGELVEIRETAERAAALTRQLLAFSRKEHDRPVVLDLNEALVGLEAMLNHLLPPNVMLRIEPADLSLNVRMDRSALEQVIVNLVVNARDAMPRGGRVWVRTTEIATSSSSLRRRAESRPGAHVRLEVQDEGEGMDQETRSRIFEPFFTTKRRGTGLGLATVFGRVEKAGGFVRVESAPDRGSTFHVFLPGVAMPAEAPRQEGARLPGTGGKRRILVVEDDDRVRAVTLAALGRFGYSVAGAPDTAGALVLARSPGGSVDLLLTDLNLPDGTGPALVRSYRELRPGVRVLFMSGYSEDETAREMEAVEGSVFLAKPFSIETLTAKVEEALAGPIHGASEGRSPDQESA